MKKSVRKMMLIAVSVMFVLMLTAGCEEEAKIDTSGKKARLVASQNLQLKKDIKQRDKKIEELIIQLQQCQQKNAHLKQQVQVKIKENTESILAHIMEEVVQLKTENKMLKKQLGQ